MPSWIKALILKIGIPAARVLLGKWVPKAVFDALEIFIEQLASDENPQALANEFYVKVKECKGTACPADLV